MNKEIKKFTYNNVMESIKVICMWPGGYEYIVEDRWNDGKFDFEPKPTYDREDKAPVRAANASLRKWKKGMRKLMKKAKQGPGAFAMMGKAYTGNGPDNIWDYFNQLYRGLSDKEIIEYGEGEKTLMTESYVNGTIETWLE